MSHMENPLEECLATKNHLPILKQKSTVKKVTQCNCNSVLEM